MNKIFNYLLLLCCLFGAAQSLKAQGEQGTDDDGFVVQITSPASIAQTIFHGFDEGVCQWVGQSFTAGTSEPYGVSLTEDLCGDVVWADDSLGCTPGVKDLTGKFALMRRGSCNFSLKMYHAQERGAIACIVLNNYGTAADGPCSTYSGTLLFGGMAGGDSASAVNIPAVFLERQTAEAIDGALAAGEAVNICFAFPRMSTPTSASMYATPLSQVDTMAAITVLYNNRSLATQTDVNVKAEIFDPSGALHGTMVYNMPVSEPSIDSFIVFPPYYAPPMKGKWTVRFTNDKYSESIDTVYSYFEHTDYTFATDNLVIDPGGVGPRNSDFENFNFKIQSGGLVLTGDAPAKATYATFAISNIDSVYIDNNPTANIIGIGVYKADVDGDGDGELSATTSSFNDMAAGLISYFSYEMTANDENDKLIHVPLTDLITGEDGVVLEPNQAYYVSLFYDGLEAGTGRCVRFGNSLLVNYASFDTYPTTPLEFGQLYGAGWDGAIVIQRLQLDGFVPGVKTVEPNVLADSKINITPNPANEFVNLELKLDAVNPSVAVSILDGRGKLVTGSQVEKNIQNGVMNLDVKNLASGVYYLWIRSAEGSTMKKIVVCH